MKKFIMLSIFEFLAVIGMITVLHNTAMELTNANVVIENLRMEMEQQKTADVHYYVEAELIEVTMSSAQEFVMSFMDINTGHVFKWVEEWPMTVDEPYILEMEGMGTTTPKDDEIIQPWVCSCRAFDENYYN